MDNSMFAIPIYSFSYDYRKEYLTQNNISVIRSISEYGREILKYFYSCFDANMKYAKSLKINNSLQLDGSVFVVNIPDGTVILHVTVIEKYNIVLSGLLLKDGYPRRAAWQLARWQLIVLAAAKALAPGFYELTLDKINEMVGTIEFDPNYEDKLFAFCEKLGTEDLPVNYAMTNFPAEKLTLDFGNNIERSYSTSAESEPRSLPIDANARNLLPGHGTWLSKYREKFKLEVFKLVYISKKEYIRDKEEELKLYDKEERRDTISELKYEFADGPDYLWVVRVGFSTYEGIYSEHLPDDLQMKVNEGRIEADVLLNFSWNAEKHALKHFKKCDKIIKDKELAKQEKREHRKIKKPKDMIGQEMDTEQDKSSSAIPQRTISRKTDTDSPIGGFVSKLFGKNNKD